MNGKFSISKTTSNQEDSFVTVELRAENSIIQVKLSMEQFARALLGEGKLDCQFSIKGTITE